jgi:hypothetical protein
MPAKKLDSEGKPTHRFFKENSKKRQFSRPGQTGSMIILIKRRNSGRAISCISSTFVKIVATRPGKLNIIVEG